MRAITITILYTMTSFRTCLAAAGLIATLASCSPYQAPPIPPGPLDPGLNPTRNIEETASQTTENAKRKATKEVVRKKKAAREVAETKRKEVNESINETVKKVTPKPIAKPKVPTFPVAKKVPGRDGFVYSPYDNTVIDVRTVPAGKLVKNPKDSSGAKRYFRVPN